MSDERIPRAYVPDAPSPAPSREELRARIPGWGADLDPADRPSVPRLDRDLPETGVLAERKQHPLRSRIGSTRVDKSHLWLDPLLVAGPWVTSGFAVFVAGRRLYRLAVRR